MRASFLALVLTLGLLTPSFGAEGPEAFVLPAYGDPQFLPAPNTDRMLFRAVDERGDTYVHWFPGTGTFSRVDSGGGVQIAFRRGDRVLQANADSLLYERSDASLLATETFQLIGNVVVVTPEGGLRASVVTLTSRPGDPATERTDVLDLEGHGNLHANFNGQTIAADQATLQYVAPTPSQRAHRIEPLHAGTVRGNVVLDFAVAATDAAETPTPMTRSLLFDGVDLTPQAIHIEGPRFRFNFDAQGLRTVEAEAPSVLQLQREDPLEGDDTPTSMTIETPLFEATFEPEPAPSAGEVAPLPDTEPTARGGGLSPSQLRTFRAPKGIVIHYLGGSIEAGFGDLDLGDASQSLVLSGGVTAEQAGAVMIAKDLDLTFDAAGLTTLEATGRPTFIFETAHFAPLAAVLSRLRPGAGVPEASGP